MPSFRVTKKLAKALGAKRQTSAVEPKASTINGSPISSSSRARSDGGLARADIEGINAQISESGRRAWLTLTATTRTRHPPHLPEEVVRGEQHSAARLLRDRQQDSCFVQGESDNRWQHFIQVPRAAPRPRVRLTAAEMDEILRSHIIDAALLRTDTFEELYAARKAALLSIVERAMCKTSAESASVAEDEDDDDV